jgi:hypothetical protein
LAFKILNKKSKTNLPTVLEEEQHINNALMIKNACQYKKLYRAEIYKQPLLVNTLGILN